MTPEQIDILYEIGRFHYSIGDYSAASDYLYHFRVLTTDADLESSAMWGKLVSDALEGSWDAALTELDLLRKHIDNHYPWEARNSVVGLQQRTWFLHWSLFVYFNHPQGRDKLVETWLAQLAVGDSLRASLRGDQQAYAFVFLSTLQANSPWLLRYLVVAVVLTKKAAFKGNVYIGATSRLVTREHLGAALITAIKQERYQYSDPITEFIFCLFVELDFAAAGAKLAQCRQVLENDFFLNEFVDEFMERCRWLYSEAYCRVHHRVDIAFVLSSLYSVSLTDTLFGRILSQQLGLSPSEGEKWIVNLIREARLDAKIDFKEVRPFHTKLI